ncbi:MAG: helix-turn-helix domain-containing protein [Chitinophagaceae bacterium]|nr:helix-turn-helix domain-containing protein [Chitinophagaceae bacterium]
MNKIAKKLGEVVAKYRNEQEMSQETLADLAQIHRTYVSQIERGLKYPTIYVLVQIAKALDVKLSDLIIEFEKRMK